MVPEHGLNALPALILELQKADEVKKVYEIDARILGEINVDDGFREVFNALTSIYEDNVKISSQFHALGLNPALYALYEAEIQLESQLNERHSAMCKSDE